MPCQFQLFREYGGLQEMASPATIDALNKKAQACLAKKADIPGSPLWNMARAAKYNSAGDSKYLQDALDYLTCKAKVKMDFTSDEKEFLKEVYEAFYWGGRYKGYKEAAELADHYVNGGGKLLRINPEVYQKSTIVQETMVAMKRYIVELKSSRINYAKIKCNNPAFMAKPYAAPLKRMNFRTEGKMKSSGVLEAAQNDHRLQKADGHFYLEAQTVAMNNAAFKTTWSVDSVYDFEPFERHDYYTEIPLGQNRMIISDGLSEYMTRIGVANAFSYRAEWTEIWK
jgi:hypothetical protein